VGDIDRGEVEEIRRPVSDRSKAPTTKCWRILTKGTGSSAISCRTNSLAKLHDRTLFIKIDAEELRFLWGR
jgi:hypothetical protein